MPLDYYFTDESVGVGVARLRRVYLAYFLIFWYSYAVDSSCTYKISISYIVCVCDLFYFYVKLTRPPGKRLSGHYPV